MDVIIYLRGRHTSRVIAYIGKVGRIERAIIYLGKRWLNHYELKVRVNFLTLWFKKIRRA